MDDLEALREPPPLSFEPSRPGRLTGLRADPLARTSTLLVVDNLALAVIGGGCTVLAARLWPEAAVGLVAAALGALNLIVAISNLGLPATIVKFLGREPRQAAFLRQALLLGWAVAAVAVLLVNLWPGHLGVPLSRFGGTPLVIGLITAGYALSAVVAVIGDPAYIARQEASLMLGKDLAAGVVRVVCLLLLAGTSARSLLLVWLLYAGSAAILDLGILRWRLTRGSGGSTTRRFEPLRSRFSFAAGNYLSGVVASVPLYTLPAMTAALLGDRTSAYVAIPLQVGTLVTVFASQTAQSLLSESARRPEHLVRTTARALRGAYAVTLPVAGVVVLAAPWLLLAFGRGYSDHGTPFLRWMVAGSVFYVFNYIADVVLLARQKVGGYGLVNGLGTLVEMVLLVIALRHGLDWLGPAWFIGEAAYAAVAGAVVARYAGRSGLGELVGALREPNRRRMRRRRSGER